MSNQGNSPDNHDDIPPPKNNSNNHPLDLKNKIQYPRQTISFPHSFRQLTLQSYRSASIRASINFPRTTKPNQTHPAQPTPNADEPLFNRRNTSSKPPTKAKRNRTGKPTPQHQHRMIVESPNSIATSDTTIELSNTENNNSITITPTPKPTRFQQTKLLTPSQLQPWGDPIETLKPSLTRIYFQNVHGTNRSEKWHDAMTAMKDKNVSIFGFAETNEKWTKQQQETYQSIAERTFKWVKISPFSCHIDDATVHLS